MQGPTLEDAVDEYGEMGMMERLQRLFYSPMVSFVSVRQRCEWPDWMIPSLAVCLAGLLYYYATAPVVLNPETPAIQQQMEQLSEEQRQQMLNNMQLMREQGWMMVVTGTLTSLMLVSGALFILARSVFRAEVSFTHMLVIKGYASVAIMMEWLVRIPLTLASGVSMVPLGPGIFLPDEAAGSWIANLLIGINIFDMWQVALMAIGLAVFGRIPFKRALWGVLGLWLMWVTSSATMATIAYQMAPQSVVPTAVEEGPQ
jgi:hypothetical protein